MTFQYFFFDTYIGYFLQALPIALLVSAIYGFIRFRKDTTTPNSRKVFSCIIISASIFMGIKKILGRYKVIKS